MTTLADPITDSAPAQPTPRDAARRRALAAWAFFAGLVALTGLGVVLSLMLGAVHLSWAEVAASLTGKGENSAVADAILWQLRLPRALLAILVGVNLAASGTLLQGVMHNPLAAPDIIGVTAGAGLAATVMLVLGTGLAGALPLVAFAGALGATALVYAVAWQPGLGTSPVRMILAGVAVGAMLGAFMSFLLVAFSDRAPSVVMWMAGSLTDANWSKLWLAGPYSLVGLAAAALLVRALDALGLGEAVAAGLGVHVERTRLIAVASASLLAAAAVSVAGLVGFVGLIVPHLARLLVGQRHTRLLPTAMAGGAALMVWADLLARTALAPTELPVGILTAVLGGPYFVFLLYRRKLA